MKRVFRTISLEFRLATPMGQSPNTQEKTWFFEVPEKRDTKKAWNELLHRIFYDANVHLRRSAPNDVNWLALDSWKKNPVDWNRMVQWNGDTDSEVTLRHLPWQLMSPIWEPSVVYYVDDEGHYDGISPYDFSELILYRCLAAGQIDKDQARLFLDRLYVGHGDATFADRSNRLRNIDLVRPPRSGQFRRVPGETPWHSGPPSHHHVDTSAAPPPAHRVDPTSSATASKVIATLFCLGLLVLSIWYFGPFVF